MTVTPAQVAGVARIVVCSPRPAKETLAAAWLAGASREFYRVGGAQAIAALAFGTASIPRVNKIVGPGNLYVTAAKILVSRGVRHRHARRPNRNRRLPARPAIPPESPPTSSPRRSTIPRRSPSSSPATPRSPRQSRSEVKTQSQANAIAKQSLAAQGFIFVTASVAESRALTNRLAPEHLTVDTKADLKWVKNAGSVFIGDYSPQSMGDYISGPNHVLPTGRVGRMRGGLSVMDFVKVITVQQYTRTCPARTRARHTIALAEAEGLVAHAQSVRVRMR